MGRVSVGLLLFVCPVWVGIAAAETEWPGFRGPNGNGSVVASLFDGGASTLEIGWKRAIGSGYSAVAVGDGRVVTMFAAGDSDVLAAFDVESGEELWRYRVSDTYPGHDGSHDGPISTPLIAGGRVFGLGPWGHLFAVDAATGEPIWTTHLVDDLGAEKPYYGFTTSPLLADGVLVLEIGVVEGKAIAGFDPETGKLLWTVGDDKIEYHSPIVASFGGQRQVVAAGKERVYGLRGKTGELLWSYEHAGDARAMGGMTIVPVPAGDDRLFLMNKIDASVMLSVKRRAGGYEIAELWSGNSLKQSYVTPVYHDGHIYGMSNRIFSCIDAATGDVVWRSREPGDGFPTIVGDHLVVITKPGILHVADASPEGYRELARLDLFDEHSWSEVAFAGKHLFARSMAHLARIDLGATTGSSTGTSWISSTGFGGFLARLDDAPNKTAAIDAFLARQPSLPIVESNGVVHFIYRGEAEDVGIVGDMIGFRREDPMTRVPETDLFYYSTRLEPDAAIAYGFIVDYGDPVPDPANPRTGGSLFGDVSWLAMPAWEAPDYLEAADGDRRGRLTTIEWTSAILEDQQRKAQIYLPAGYEEQLERRYPVVYVHHGQDALDAGGMQNALDHLIGRSVEPLIGVFVVADEEKPLRDINDEKYSEMIAEELVSKVDAEFRTIDDASARASIGSGRTARAALQTALRNPDVFGRLASQSLQVMGADAYDELIPSAEERPLVIYLEWGTYHQRSPHEAWDLAEGNRELWRLLRDRGHRPAGGEVPEGFGWTSWQARTDELLAAMFPLRR